MKLVEPKVELVAESCLDTAALESYLEEIGAGEYRIDEGITDLEELVKIAGKACYKSFVPGLNPNVTRVRDDSGKYIDNINKIGHGSVLEHGWVTLVFWNVSRVFTHELVRHRAGTAMSQESLRYVRLDDLDFWIPPEIAANEEAEDLFITHIRRCEELQKQLAEIYDIENLGMKEKKKLTSAFRRVAPIGLGTAMVWSMNMRTARHLLQLRTYPDAEVEIRVVFDQVGKILTDRFPAIFNDFEREEDSLGIGTWVCKNAAMPYDNVKIRKLENKIKELEEKLCSVKLEEQ